MRSDDVSLLDLTIRDNLTDGVLADGATNLLIEDSQIFDNQAAGVRISGTDGVTIRGSELFSSTPGGGASEGTGGPGSQTNGVRTGDVITRNTTIEDTVIRDHGRYGIEVINRTVDEDLGLEVLVRHENLVVRNSHLDGNGNQFTAFFGDADDSLRFGNVLLQGVNGGLWENNLIENGGAWGIDSYAGTNITFRNNLIPQQSRAGSEGAGPRRRGHYRRWSRNQRRDRQHRREQHSVRQQWWLVCLVDPQPA